MSGNIFALTFHPTFAEKTAKAMKRIITLMGLLCALLSGKAQDEKESQMQQLTVEASRIVERDDGQTIFPSSEERQASTNAYSLLAKLGLPNLRIDEVQRTVTALDNKGEVQLRINGTLASRNDLLALDPAMVRSIAFIDNPSLRYGSEVGYVLDIRTRRGAEGYTLGADLGGALNTRMTDNTVFSKVNRGRSEFAVSYDMAYSDLRGMRYDEVARYAFADGSLHTVSRHDLSSLWRSQQHNAELKYSLADSGKYVFQASLSALIDRTPRSDRTYALADNRGQEMFHTHESDASRSPSLDLYLFRQLPRHQTLTANAVATCIGSSVDHAHDEGGLYAYGVRGHSQSLTSEVLYELPLRPFTLTAGLQLRLKNTRNTYSGDVEARSHMLTHNEYLFAEAKRRWQGLSLTGGLGVSSDNYSQAGHRYHYWLFRPKLTARYSWDGGWSMGYTFVQNSHVSQVAMVSDTQIRQNSMEWTVGNPRLRPNRVVHHEVRMALQRPRFSNTLLLYYRHHVVIGALIERTDDNVFLRTQTNQGRIDMSSVQDNVRYEIVRHHLAAQFSAALYHFRNEGSDYDHRLTTCNVSGSMQAYWGRWTLTANADNGWHFMECETRSRQGAATYLTCSYEWRGWTFSAF